MTLPVGLDFQPLYGLVVALAVVIHGAIRVLPHSDVLRWMGALSWLFVIGGFLWLIYDKYVRDSGHDTLHNPK